MSPTRYSGRVKIVYLEQKEGEHACKDHQQQHQTRDPSGAHLV